jgi:hypothetical protein
MGARGCKRGGDGGGGGGEVVMGSAGMAMMTTARAAEVESTDVSMSAYFSAKRSEAEQSTKWSEAELGTESRDAELGTLTLGRGCVVRRLSHQFIVAFDKGQMQPVQTRPSLLSVSAGSNDEQVRASARRAR